ncbi:hypothetical protein L6452_05643 [Arctium lappa]|uniref:Uncharacterized protein n=1 Tax=Arctium lappa TaxID=4217 RepID=A0ACB9EH97_ARCLA|nr:hypothetical protein L6452_05643 [Arctium lappa]
MRIKMNFKRTKLPIPKISNIFGRPFFCRFLSSSAEDIPVEPPLSASLCRSFNRGSNCRLFPHSAIPFMANPHDLTTLPHSQCSSDKRNRNFYCAEDIHLSVDNRNLTVLREGTLVPKFWDKIFKYSKDKEKEKDKDKDNVYQDSDDSSDEEINSAIGRYIVKKTNEYTEEDKCIVGLDYKVRAIIDLDLPDEVYHSLVNLSTAKEMWSTLCVLLLNDLKLLGRLNDNEEVLCKFMDGLPDFWENIYHHSEAYLSEADDEGEETSVDQVTEEMGMLANFSMLKNNHSSNRFRTNRSLLYPLRNLWINPKRNAMHVARKAILRPSAEATLQGNPNQALPTLPKGED